jgi:hypothetical protein
LTIVLSVFWPLYCLSFDHCIVMPLCLEFCVICVYFRIVVSNTYCVVFLLCFSSSCVPFIARFSGLSINDCPFGIL